MRLIYSGRFPLIASVAATVLAACGSASTPPLSSGLSLGLRSAASSPIQHVVIVVQENRSFDDFFALFPGAHGATRGKEKVKVGGKYVDKWVKLKPAPLLMGKDIQHCHTSFKTDYDDGKMDGFNLDKFGVCNLYGKPVGTAVYQYVRQTDIAPYWDIAEQYVLADHLFQTQGSGSFTAHQDLIRGGTSIDQSGTGYTESLIDNPTGMAWGCDAGKTAKTELITVDGKYENDGPFPCTSSFPSSGGSYTTLRDLLDNAGVSWKYYSPCFLKMDGCNPSEIDKSCPDCAGGLLNAFDVIAPVRYGSEWGTSVSMPETNIFADITNGMLPAVSWVIPEDANSDHPGDGTVDNGPSWVASVVNAVGQSSYWDSTAIVIVWDDWGGFYDNAKPPFQDKQGGLGFRVPAMIVSAYAKVGKSSQGGYVSHTQYEFGSILKYIEHDFGLPSLHTTDARANSIGDVFDYKQKPRAFNVIPSFHDATYFITHREPFSRGDPE